MVWEMLRILPKQHPSWVMHQSFACGVPDMVIIEASLARGWATREMQGWFSASTVAIEAPAANVNLRPPAVRGEKTGRDRREEILDRYGDQITLMISNIAGESEFAAMVFFSKSSRGDIFFSREAVEAALPGISYFHSW